MEEANVLDMIGTAFRDAVEGSFGFLAPEMRIAQLFALAMGILLTIAALAVSPVREAFGRGVFTMIFLGVVTWMGIEWPAIVSWLRGTAIEYGQIAGGAEARGMSAGAILRTGLEVIAPLTDWFDSFWDLFHAATHPVDTLAYLIALFVTLISFILFAVAFTVFDVMFQFAALAGFLLFMFAAWPPTAWIAEAAMGAVIMSGARVFLMQAIGGIAGRAVGSLAVGGDLTALEAISLAGGALFILLIGWLVPSVIASAISGRFAVGAAEVFRAAQMGGSVMVSAGAAAVNGARMWASQQMGGGWGGAAAGGGHAQTRGRKASGTVPARASGGGGTAVVRMPRRVHGKSRIEGEAA